MESTALLVKMVIDRWNGSIVNLNKHLNDLTDQQLQLEVAPGKNRGIYLLGHLVAVHDDMMVLLGMGEKLFPELHEPFIAQPDNSSADLPSAAEIRSCWARQCAYLQEKFDHLKPEQWLEKHTAVSVEDFSKEPQRNKLNIVITRTSHLQYHSGQLVLLK